MTAMMILAVLLVTVAWSTTLFFVFSTDE
jgi:hypothetical protein